MDDMPADGATTLPAPRWLSDRRVQGLLRFVTAAGAFYFVQQLLWPSPLGIVVNGMVLGGLTALVSLGIALVYRANRIVNFAQGDIGAAPAVLAVLLIVGPGLPYFVAMPLGIVVGGALGALIELLVIRRFFRAPRLILTVATLGLTQLLVGLGLLLPLLFDFNVPPQSFPSPFDFSFEIDPVIFHGNDIIAMLAVPLAIGGLLALFKLTTIGIAIRGSAESAERAVLLGIPVKRVQTLVWVLAAVLSTTAMLLRAGIVGLPIGQVVGPTVLLQALAAAVIGRMERLPTIVAAAIGIGIIEQSIVWHTGRSVIVAPILFAVVLFGLLLQRRGTVARTDEQSTWQAAQEVRPVPRELAVLPVVRRLTAALRVAGIAALAIAPLVLSESRLNLFGAVLIYAIVGVSLVVLTGWGGQISLGHMAFVGVGAAVAGSLTSRLHWDTALAIVVAGLVGAVVAVVIGLPALRIRGLFLAVTTLAFALAASDYFLNHEFFDWWLPEGRLGRPPLLGRISIESEPRFYFLVLAYFLAVVAAVSRFRRTRTGRALVATRENERAAQAYGLSTTSVRLTAFAISGFFAASAGGLFVFHQQALGVNPFKPAESLALFVMVVIGGLGSVSGALLGAFYVRGLTWFLPVEYQFLTNGVGLLIVLMISPGGLSAIAYQLRDVVLKRIADAHHVIVPSLVADIRTEKDDDIVVIASAHVRAVDVDLDLVADDAPARRREPLVARSRS